MALDVLGLGLRDLVPMIRGVDIRSLAGCYTDVTCPAATLVEADQIARFGLPGSGAVTVLLLRFVVRQRDTELP